MLKLTIISTFALLTFTAIAAPKTHTEYCTPNLCAMSIQELKAEYDASQYITWGEDEVTTIEVKND